MWTFLRLLTMEESLEQFLEIETKDNVPELVEEAEKECAELKAEVEALRRKGQATSSTPKSGCSIPHRTPRNARQTRRTTRHGEVQSRLVVAEQERLDQQIKLIRGRFDRDAQRARPQRAH
jgi:hypothetical protein